MPICKSCNKLFSNYIVIENKIRNVCKRKYCLECSPFGLHNTQKLIKGYIVEKDKKICPKCKEQKSRSEFYKSNGRTTCFCKKCFYEMLKKRWDKRKIEVITYKGGCCKLCGYNKNYAALELHHQSKKDKIGSWRKIKLMTEKRLWEEVKKCILVCSNCHRELHNPKLSNNKPNNQS